MKLLKMLKFFWKYRNYETIFYVDSHFEVPTDIKIRRAKLLSIDGYFMKIALYDCTVKTVHRGWVADTKKSAKVIQDDYINFVIRSEYE